MLSMQPICSSITKVLIICPVLLSNGRLPVHMATLLSALKHLLIYWVLLEHTPGATCFQICYIIMLLSRQDKFYLKLKGKVKMTCKCVTAQIKQNIPEELMQAYFVVQVDF